MGPRAGLCCGAETSRGHQRAEEVLHPGLQHPRSGGTQGRTTPTHLPVPSWGTQRGHRELLTRAPVPISSGMEHAVVSPHLVPHRYPISQESGCRDGCWGWGFVLGCPPAPTSLRASQVSLDSRVREVINRKMQEPSSHTFDDAQLQIYTLMHRDSYPRFLNSAIYKSLLQSVSHSSSES